MKRNIKHDFKVGTSIQFKWYDDWRDEFENPNNFKVLEGTIDSNTALDEVIVYNEHEKMFYAVGNEYILKVF
jgi:hypothetical protein